MFTIRATVVTFSLALVWGCIPDTGTGPVDSGFQDTPGAITAPIADAKVVAGDTVEISWTNRIENPVISYNYNDSDLYYFKDAQWHAFPNDQIVSVTSTSARVRTESFNVATKNYRLRVTESSSGNFTESGPLTLDHIKLLSPIDGATYMIGQTVPIRFKRNRFMKRVYLTFAVGLGEDRSFSLTGEMDINFDEMGLGDVTTVYDTTWTIGTELFAPQTKPYPSDSCYIYAYSYYLGQQFRGDPRKDGLTSDHNEIPFRITAP